MSLTALSLAGFIAWALLLLVWMEALRSWLVLRGRVAPNAFTPDNATLSPFMQRIARAHLNCVEGLPIFGGLMLLAIATGLTHLTDMLAPWLLAARILQSVTHLVSVASPAVTLRFCFFAVQMGIGVWWAVRLLAALVA